MMTHSPWTFVSATLFVAMLGEGTARADNKGQAASDAARADELFKAAKDDLKRGLAADACANFAESKRLAPGVGVALYLGDCYQRVGRTASAWATFHEAEALAREKKDKRAELAHQRAQALEAKLNHLTIQVIGPAPAAPLEVNLDGRHVAQEDWGGAIPVDPGEHVVTAQAGAWSRTYGASIDAKSASTTVTINLPTPEANPTPPVGSPAGVATSSSSAEAHGTLASRTEAESSGPARSTENSGAARLWLTVGLGTAAVAGLGLGTVYGIMATSHRNQSNDGPCNAADYCSGAGLSLRQQALSEATISTVAFIVGLAAGAGAVAAYALAPGSSSPTGLTVSPSPVGGGTGAILRSSF